jgi:hypothetical protein
MRAWRAFTAAAAMLPSTTSFWSVYLSLVLKLRPSVLRLLRLLLLMLPLLLVLQLMM